MTKERSDIMIMVVPTQIFSTTNESFLMILFPFSDKIFH